MARRSRQEDPEFLRKKLLVLIQDFESELKKGDLRNKVISLVPVHHTLRDLGSSLIPRASAKTRAGAHFVDILTKE